jgi:hypothetical protein
LPFETPAPVSVVAETEKTPCHETGSQTQTRHDDNHGKTSSSCQLHCDLAATPFLLPQTLTTASSRQDIQHDTVHPLRRGIRLPPDHPPPIA